MAFFASFARDIPSHSNPRPAGGHLALFYIDGITQAYLDFARQTKGTLLEIAAGYGHIVIKTLEAGGGKVFANEIDVDQLAIIKSRTPAEYSDKLVCCLGQFPERLEFPDGSFDGIYNARLFHFFDGDRIRAALFNSIDG